MYVAFLTLSENFLGSRIDIHKYYVHYALPQSIQYTFNVHTQRLIYSALDQMSTSECSSHLRTGSSVRDAICTGDYGEIADKTNSVHQQPVARVDSIEPSADTKRRAWRNQWFLTSCFSSRDHHYACYISLHVAIDITCKASPFHSG